MPISPALPPAEAERGRGSLPYVLPFVVFLAFLALQAWYPLPGRADAVVRFFVMAAVLWFFSRPVLDLRMPFAWQSVLLGIAVFVLWIGPDLLFHYRGHWLFQNSITGTVKSSLSDSMKTDPLILTFRFLRAVVIVPVVEELFWRAWLMRWLINPKFATVPLGTYRFDAFWITALLFASEHGPFWEVGLITGAIYNWWMIRTRSLGDCILAHAVTNAVLSGYVLYSGKWEYWL